MKYGLDVTVFKDQDGIYETSGHCCVRRKENFARFSWTRCETYPIFVSDQDLRIVARQLVGVLRHHHGRGELDECEALGGVLRAKFPNDFEIFHPFPGGVSRILIPLSQEEIFAFWETLRAESTAK